jgi:hypothetical protein
MPLPYRLPYGLWLIQMRVIKTKKTVEVRCVVGAYVEWLVAGVVRDVPSVAIWER